MLTNRIRILWVKVHIRGGKNFYINLPISLYAFKELLDCIMDLVDVACFLTPAKQLAASSLSIGTISSLMKSFIKLADLLVGGESYDLLDVEADNVKVSIKIG